MARDTSPIVKQSRREGVALHPKAHKIMARKSGIPGQHGQGRQGKQSMYATQLREKQKLKRLYGIQERPMQNLFDNAIRMKGVTGENLLSMLERRFDNVVYRIGFAASRKEARQLVKHFHFTVNGKCANVPSMLIDKGDVIELHSGSRQSAKLTGSLEANSIREVPAWLSVEKSSFKATVLDLPKREDITTQIEERLVVELYSK